MDTLEVGRNAAAEVSPQTLKRLEDKHLAIQSSSSSAGL